MSSNELMFSLANSPPVRWGLLDFMSATCRPASPPPPPPLFLLLSASSSFSCDQVCSVWRAGPQLRSCEISVPRRTSTAILWDQCSAPDLNCDPVRSVFRAGPQLRSCEISVPHRTSTAILWDQCSAPDLNCDPVRSVFRAGPQLRSCEISVPHRTSTAILWDQCSAPDLSCDPVRSVFRTGPQLRSCEISVPHRTSTAILWDQCSAPDLNCDPVRSVFRTGPQPRSCEISVPRRTSTAKCVRRYVRKNVRRYVGRKVRKNVKRYVRKTVAKICQRECQKMCQRECLCAWGGPLPCLCPVYSNTSARWYTDRFWQMVVACLLKHFWQVLYWVADRTRQDHAKIQKKRTAGLLVLKCHWTMVPTFWTHDKDTEQEWPVHSNTKQSFHQTTAFVEICLVSSSENSAPGPILQSPEAVAESGLPWLPESPDLPGRSLTSPVKITIHGIKLDDNPHLTTPTQHVMVGITRSKVILCTFCIFFLRSWCTNVFNFHQRCLWCLLFSISGNTCAINWAICLPWSQVLCMPLQFRHWPNHA